MQPCSREMQAINSLLNPSQIPLQQHHSQIQNPHFEPASHDDFLEQMLSSLPSCSWADPAVKSSPWDPRPDETAPSSNPSDNVGFHATHFSDEPAILASKLRQHQISGGSPSAAPKMMMQHQHPIMMMPLSLGTDRPQNDVVDGSSSSSFKSPNSHQGGEGSVQGLYNGFGGGSLHGAGQAPHHPQHFHHPQGGSMQAQNLGGPGGVMNQGQGQGQGQVQGQSQAQASGSTGGAAAQPRQRVRARRGQATDPHSIAERLRRERIAERMKALQELVPNANKTDKASMLDEIIDYVKFLQLQVKVLSMSRLGGAAAVAPLVADISSEGGGDCIQASSNANANANANASSHSNNHTASSNDSLTVTEHQVAKLMEEDMGSAMQYLQGKGLCLMPISLATAISTATCHSRNPIINNSSNSNNNNNNNNPLLQPNADGPSSPSMSVLTVQSATVGNGGPDTSAKDAASVSKP